MFLAVLTLAAGLNALSFPLHPGAHSLAAPAKPQTLANGTFPLNFPTQLAVDGSGNLHVGDVVMDPEYAVSLGSVVIGIAADSSGALWAVDVGHNTVVHVTVNPATQRSIFKQLDYAPTGIAVDSTRGRVYVSNSTANAIEVYSAKTAAHLATIH